MKRSPTFRLNERQCYQQQPLHPMEFRPQHGCHGESSVPSYTQDVGMLASSMMMVSISDRIAEDDDEGNMSRSSSSSSTSAPSSAYESDRTDGTLAGWGSAQSRASYKIDLCSLGADDGELFAEQRRKRRHCMERCGPPVCAPPPPPASSPETYFPALYSDFVPPPSPSFSSPHALPSMGTTATCADASWGYYVDAVTPGRCRSSR